MQKIPPASLPTPLLALGAAVLAIHLWLLQFAPGHLPATPPAALRGPLIVRPLDAEAKPAAVAAPQPARPRPPRRPPAPVAAPTVQAPAAPAPAEATLPPPPAAAEPQAVAAEPPSEPAAAPEPQAAASAPTPPAAAPAPIYAVPGSTRLKYDVSGTVRGLNYSARGELLWRHDGERYDARLEIGAFLLGSRVQTSRGRLTGHGLEPRRFSDKVRSEVAAHFEREKGKIIFSANTPEIPLEPGAQDHLSVFIQLASLFAGQPGRHASGSTLELQAVGAREAAAWRFVVEGPERLQLPGGEQDTLKLTRPPAHPYDLKAELWLAPALGWLPVRIRLTQDNGDFVDQQWRTSETP